MTFEKIKEAIEKPSESMLAICYVSGVVKTSVFPGNDGLRIVKKDRWGFFRSFKGRKLTRSKDVYMIYAQYIHIGEDKAITRKSFVAPTLDEIRHQVKADKSLRRRRPKEIVLTTDKMKLLTA